MQRQSYPDAHGARKQVGIQRVCSLDCVQQVPAAVPAVGAKGTSRSPGPLPADVATAIELEVDDLSAQGIAFDAAEKSLMKRLEAVQMEKKDQERGDHSEGGGREDEDAPGQESAEAPERSVTGATR